MPNGSTLSFYDKAIDALGRFGFPIVMCFVFISWEAGWLPSKTRELANAYQQHLIQSEQSTRDLIAALTALRVSMRSQIIFQACLTSVRDAKVQEECLKQLQPTTVTVP